MPITIDDLVYSVGLDDSDMRAGATRIEKTIRGLSQFAAGLSGAFAFPVQMLGSWEAFGTAVQQAGRAIFDFSKQATIFDTVEMSFTRIAQSARQSGSSILQAMQQATAGTVDALTLMQQANQAFMLGLEVTPERMTQLMQIARSAAQSTGQEFSYMVESIIGGLGRQEREILDNLGIVVRADDAYQKYAQSIGKTATQLTESEKKQAFMNEALRIGMENLQKAGGIQESATEKFATMDVAIKQLQISIGHLFAPATTGLLSAFATGISSLADGLAQLPPLFESATEKAERLSKSYQDLKVESESQIQTITDLQNQYNALNQQLSSGNLSADESRRVHDELNEIIKKIIDSVPGAGAVFREYGNDINKVNEYLNDSKKLHADLLRFTERERAQALRQSFMEAQQEVQKAENRMQQAHEAIANRLQVTAETFDAAMLATTGVITTASISFEDFQAETVRAEGRAKDLKQQLSNLGATATVESRKIVQFIEEMNLDEAIQGINDLNRAATYFGKLSETDQKKLEDYQAQIRDTFGLGITEGEKWIKTLRTIWETSRELPKGMEKPSAVIAAPTIDIKKLTSDVKIAVAEFERAQKVAAQAAGEMYKPKLEAIYNTAQAFVKAQLQEKQITDDSVIYQETKYGELADYLLDLWEKVAKDRQQTAEEGLKTELETIDRQIEAREISYQQAITNLSALQQQYQKNARAIELISEKTAIFQRKQAMETQKAQIDAIKSTFENLKQLKEMAAVGLNIPLEIEKPQGEKVSEVFATSATEWSSESKTLIAGIATSLDVLSERLTSLGKPELVSSLTSAFANLQTQIATTARTSDFNQAIQSLQAFENQVQDVQKTLSAPLTAVVQPLSPPDIQPVISALSQMSDVVEGVVKSIEGKITPITVDVTPALNELEKLQTQTTQIDLLPFITQLQAQMKEFPRSGVIEPIVKTITQLSEQLSDITVDIDVSPAIEALMQLQKQLEAFNLTSIDSAMETLSMRLADLGQVKTLTLLTESFDILKASISQAIQRGDFSPVLQSLTEFQVQIQKTPQLRGVDVAPILESITTLQTALNTVAEMKIAPQVEVPSLQKFAKDFPQVLALYNNYHKKSAQERAAIDLQAIEAVYALQKTAIQNNIKDEQTRANLLGNLDEQLTAARTKAAQARIDALKSAADKEKAIHERLWDFQRGMVDATSQDALKSQKERLDEFIQANSVQISGNVKLQKMVEKVNQTYKNQGELLFDLRMEIVRLQNAQRDLNQFEESAARDRKRRDDEWLKAQEWYLNKRREKMDLDKQATAEYVSNLFKMQRNVEAMQAKTPWGIIQLLPRLEAELRSAENVSGKFSDEWMKALENVQGAWGDLFDMTSEGLEALGVQLDDSQEKTVRFMEALVMGDAWGILTSGLGLVISLFNQVDEDAGKAQQSIRQFTLDARESLRSAFAGMFDPNNYQDPIDAFVDGIQQMIIDRVIENVIASGEISQLDHLVRMIDNMLSGKIPLDPFQLREKMDYVTKDAQYIAEDLVYIFDALGIDIAQKVQQLPEIISSGLSSLTATIQGIWLNMFNPDYLKDPIQEFQDALNNMVLNILAQTIMEQSAIQEWGEIFGKTLSDALSDGVIDATEHVAIQKALVPLKVAFRGATDVFQDIANSMGYVIEETAAEVTDGLHEIDSSTQSGTQRVISVIKRGFQEGDLSTLGEELGRDFSDSFYDLLSEEMVKQSALEALWKDFGATFRTAMEGGLTEAEIASLRKLREDIIAEGEEIAGELDKVMADLGIDITNTAQESVSSAGREASEQFIESFTSGMSSSISSSLSRSIEAGFDIVEYGTDLAEQFNRAFMNTIIEKMVEASALKPMLEQFGGDLFAALQDSVLDPVETQILKTQKDQMILTSKQLGRNVDDAMRALDIEFAQKEAEAAAGREETETFQTISNITRFQANQIVAQLSLHGSYLKTIADTNIKIVELNNAIAESTRTLQLQKITINQSNGLDDKTLADRNLQTQQAQGLQI